ncbi:molybdopterin-dependent oxidoreductase [Escherichia coli]|nr:molybdopterin-dependent oxidoreductase [Escherichia coli]
MKIHTTEALMKAEISRRSLMKTSALGSLALASSAFTLPFSQMVRAAEAPVEEKAVWSSCTVNCGSRCLLRLHVKDDTVYWVESDTTGDDVYGNHQVRACLRGRSIRRRMNHPDRLKYPMKRVGKRGEGKFERISWDEALDTISDNLRRILKDYGNEAVHVLYGTGVDGGNITNSNVPYRLMNSCGGFLSRYGSYSTAQISAAMSYMFGANDGNSPDDIANTKLVVMFGNNPAETRMSGGNSGVREGSWDLGVEWFPMLENPVKTQISVFTWTDAIDHGKEMTATRDGVRGKEKLDVPIKFLWCYASNTLINQHGDINHTHEVLQDDSKCEMIVGIDHFMTASAKYCDILLPDLMPTEQEDLISHESAGNMGYVILAQPATSAKFERKPIYWMLSEVAKRLGPDVYQTFTEGRSQHEWIKYLHAKTKERNPEMPDYEEMKTTGIFKKKCPEEHYVAFRAFREDPQANPLKTPSGKIEIYSERLAKIADTWELKKDEIIHPLPAYTPGFDGWDDPLRKTYPLQLTGFHYKARTHSSYGNIDVLQQACPQEVWINPIDAQARGIRHGDTVRVFNNNGEMLIAAKVTPRILPGVTAIGQGAWLKADMFGDRVDHGGSINILTSHRPSPLAKGNPSHSNLVQIEKV